MDTETTVSLWRSEDGVLKSTDSPHFTAATGNPSVEFPPPPSTDDHLCALSCPLEHIRAHVLRLIGRLEWMWALFSAFLKKKKKKVAVPRPSSAAAAAAEAAAVIYRARRWETGGFSLWEEGGRHKTDVMKD